MFFSFCLFFFLSFYLSVWNSKHEFTRVTDVQVNRHVKSNLATSKTYTAHTAKSSSSRQWKQGGRNNNQGCCFLRYMWFGVANNKLIKCQDERVTTVAWASSGSESYNSAECWGVNDVIMSRMCACVMWKSLRQI